MAYSGTEGCYLIRQYYSIESYYLVQGQVGQVEGKYWP